MNYKEDILFKISNPQNNISVLFFWVGLQVFQGNTPDGSFQNKKGLSGTLLPASQLIKYFYCNKIGLKFFEGRNSIQLKKNFSRSWNFAIKEEILEN